MLGSFADLDPFSYALYIVHKPIVQIAVQRAPLGKIWLELFWVVPIVLGLSWFDERWIHRYVVKLLPAGREVLPSGLAVACRSARRAADDLHQMMCVVHTDDGVALS